MLSGIPSFHSAAVPMAHPPFLCLRARQYTTVFSLCTVARIFTGPTQRSSIRRDGKPSGLVGAFCHLVEARECVLVVSQTSLTQIRPLESTVNMLISRYSSASRAASLDRSRIHNGPAHARVLRDPKPRLRPMDRMSHADMLLK